MRQMLGIVVIALPILFNVFFALLSAKFDYPEILRKPTGTVLERFSAGGNILVMIWWGFAATAVAFAPISAALAVEWGTNEALTTATIVSGALAGLVQFLGLMRWPFLVPHLAREFAVASEAKKETIDVVFQSANRFLGVAVGEHLGYLFTGLWTVLLSVSMLTGVRIEPILGILGCLVGLLLSLCAFEFVGRNEATGWKFAAVVTPYAYIAWSLWLVVIGGWLVLA